ncbi:MAG: hypothetical protein AB1714_16725 [Acidobacteriota bacterium]
MWDDEIVEETRRARQAFAAKYRFEIAAMCEALKQAEQKNPQRKVSFASASTEAEARLQMETGSPKVSRSA